ncbi:AraC family transcriptional regulator [Amycolatopsis mongoliensis]|uniref:AraC family transcriptional regulator n=1 Tax=Amycolatopsis mongoliensis TaxID=715475 RepID=A0A9Y2K1K5_9PSEU|nr:AraC family transcriptional regulator [Amycolatopsis sp. 4-36]WIY07596.1 AraC family transcriptional regulator [Amycolatopsis sp. 4-36]
MSRVLAPHTLRVLGSDTRLDARMHHVRLRDMSVSVISYGGTVRFESGPAETFFTVFIPIAGEGEARCGAERVRLTIATAGVLSPAEPVVLRWPGDCVQLVVRLERAALEARLSDLLGAPLRKPLRFAPAMAVGSGNGRSWLRGLQMLVTELERPGSLIEQQAVAEMFERTLATALLMGHSSNYTRMLDGEVPAVPVRAVSIALEWIDNHPKWRHTTASLAREADVTERSLQLGFRKHLKMGPMEYLREIRLRGVRDQLRAAQSDAVTVTEVAAEWGFLHAGHFAARYQQRFGERPSETLRR